MSKGFNFKNLGKEEQIKPEKKVRGKNQESSEQKVVKLKSRMP